MEPSQKILNKIMRWGARLTIVPISIVTYDSLKMIYIGIVENKPQIIPFALKGFLLGIFFVIISVYGGLYKDFKDIDELRLEVERLKLEIEELKMVCSQKEGFIHRA